MAWRTAFVYGGSGSGKSAFAENLLAPFGARGPDGMPLVYVATMLPAGRDAEERIARHRAARAGKGFVTREIYADLASAEIPGGAAVLLECLGNLAANELFRPGGVCSAATAREAVLRGVEALVRRAARAVIVSNDVVSGGAAHPEETMRYMELLAGLNRELASRADLVVETVCGIPLRHKGEREGA